MQSIGDFDATIAAAGYRDTEITQEHVPQKKRGGSQLNRNQTTRESERERTHESRERREWGGSQLSLDQNKKKEST